MFPDSADLNGDGRSATAQDLAFMVDDIYRGGPVPGCPNEADLNRDGTPANILDLTFIVDFIFRGGQRPGPCEDVFVTSTITTDKPRQLGK